MPRHILTLATVFLMLTAGLAGVPAKAQNRPAIPGATTLPDGNLQVGDITIRRAAGELAFPAKIVLEAGPPGSDYRPPAWTPARNPAGDRGEGIANPDDAVPAGQKMAEIARTGQKQGTLVDIDLEWVDSKGEKQQPIENWILDRRTEKPMQRIGWTFVGSIIQEGQFLADVEGNGVVNYSVGSTVLDVPDPESLEDDTLHSVHTEPVRAAGGAGKAVTVVFKPRRQ